MLRTLFAFLLSVLALLIVACGMLLGFANTDAGRRWISATATGQLGREVTYTGNAYLRAKWPPTLHVSGLRIANTENGRAEDMLHLGAAEVAISPFALLIGKVKLPYIFIDDSTLHLERLAQNQGNWQFGEPDGEDAEEDSTPPELGTLYLRNTTLTYYDVPQSIDLAIQAKTEKGNLVATGKGTYLGKAFGLDVKGGALLDARTDNPYPVDAKLNVGKTLLHAKGTVQDPSHLGGMDITLRVKGDDASELFPLVGIALPPTPPYDIRGALKYAGDVWTFKPFKGTMGNSDLSGDLTWDQSAARPKLTAHFVSQKLDFKDLGPLIGVKSGAADDGSQEDSPYVIPDVPLDVSRLAAMDADVTFTGKEVISPSLPLDDFLLHVTLDDRLLTIDPVKFGTADGDIAARLTVNSRETPVQIDSDFHFARLSLARLTEGVQKALPGVKDSGGLIGGTAKLKGEGKSLKDMLSTANGNIGIGMEGGQLSNLLVELIGLDVAQSVGFFIAGDKVVPVRCIIGDFGVENGVMTSRALVMDTADTNVRGEGTINLGSEEMDIRIVPQPKDGTILSLRTPIRIEGTMKHPDIVIEKGALLARGAGAAALITLAPVAGLLAFLEPGLGEDSDCATLVRDMNRHTGTSDRTNNVPENANTPKTQAKPAAEKPETPTDPQQNIKPPMQKDIVPHAGESNPIDR